MFRNYIIDLSKVQPIYYDELKKAVLLNIKVRMEPIMKRKEYILATILDPRIKCSVFCRKILKALNLFFIML